MNRRMVWLAGLAVAVGAATLTAHGVFEVAVAARVPRGVAWVYPLITDGLALVAYASTSKLAGASLQYAWGVVVVAAGLSGLAQAAYLASDAALDPERALPVSAALRFGVGAWPAVAAAVVAHLLYLLGSAGSDMVAAEPDAPAAAPVPVVVERVAPPVEQPATDPLPDRYDEAVAESVRLRREGGSGYGATALRKTFGLTEWRAKAAAQEAAQIIAQPVRAVNG